ncbi:MAG: hypothetical protein ABI120_15055, partial [Gemmatimonadaceae bacterium]
MSDRDSTSRENTADESISRRSLLRSLGIVIAGAPFAAVPLAEALAQGRCRLKLGSIGCDTTAIKPLFGATGWKTTSLDHITIQVADYRKEAAFYSALMGWTLRSDNGQQAVMDFGTLGSVVLKQMPPAPAVDTSGGRGGGAGGGRAAPSRASVEGVCWGISPWEAKTVQAELAKRELAPVADNDG